MQNTPHWEDASKVEVEYVGYNNFRDVYISTIRSLADLCYMLDRNSLIKSYVVRVAGEQETRQKEFFGLSENYLKWSVA